MDWSPREAFLARDPDTLEEFVYEVDAALPLAIIQAVDGDVSGFQAVSTDDTYAPDSGFWKEFHVSDNCRGLV
jgi:hypothetical protein